MTYSRKLHQSPNFSWSDYPALAQFASTYTRQRRGKTEIVNRTVVGQRRAKASLRGRIPLGNGELIAKVAGRAKRDSRDIKERFSVGLKRGGVVVRGQGNIAGYQLRGGGFAGYQPNRYQRDVALMSLFPALAEFKRGPDKKKRKRKAPGMYARLLGKNSAKYKDINRNMKVAQEIYRQGRPGLLEQWGIIPHRRG